MDVALTCKLLYLKHVLWSGGSFCLSTELMAHRFLGHSNERAECKGGLVCVFVLCLSSRWRCTRVAAEGDSVGGERIPELTHSVAMGKFLIPKVGI